jgi:uncharacterized protein (TIGR02466 family)
MTVRDLFATRLYEATIDDAALLGELAHSIRTLANDDEAGKKWSRDKNYRGYTSYASLNDLPRRDPAFADLQRILSKHAAAFARELALELPRKLRLDSIWVNLLEAGGHHSAHIHPQSILSGSFYVEVPKGGGTIRFEDPRLPMMMAAPSRPDLFVPVEPRAGMILMWESWLRHEVMPGAAKDDRLSISFNFT